MAASNTFLHFFAQRCLYLFKRERKVREKLPFGLARCTFGAPILIVQKEGGVHARAIS